MTSEPRRRKGPSDREQPVSLRERQRDLTRSLIMQAGEQVFADRGYVAARVEDIATAAGTNRTTFYLHFAGKNDLVRAIFAETKARGLKLYERLDEILTRPPAEARSGLREWLAGTLSAWHEHAAIRASLVEASAVDPEIARVRINLSTALIDSLQNAHWRKLGEEGATTRSRALMLEIMTQQLQSVISSGALDSISDEIVVDFLTELWWDALGDPAAELPGTSTRV
jgi:AcrR family transcriptional regulator